MDMCWYECVDLCMYNREDTFDIMCFACLCVECVCCLFVCCLYVLYYIAMTII